MVAGIPERIGLPGRGRLLLLNRRRLNWPRAARRWSRSTRRWPRRRTPPAPARDAVADPVLHLPPSGCAGADDRPGPDPPRYWAMAPGAEYGPAGAGRPRTTPRWRARCTSSPASRWCCWASGKEAAMAQGIADEAGAGVRCWRAGPRSTRRWRWWPARGLVSNDSGLMRNGRGLRPAAGGRLRPSTSPEHTAAERARRGDLAARRAGPGLRRASSASARSAHPPPAEVAPRSRPRCCSASRPPSASSTILSPDCGGALKSVFTIPEQQGPGKRGGRTAGWC